MTSLAVPNPADTELAIPAETSFLSRPRSLERMLLALTLFVYAWGTPLEWFGGISGDSSPLTQALFLLFFLHTVIALNGNWHVVLAGAKREPLIPAFIALAILSSLWSTDPTSTFQDSVVLAITYITAMHLVVRFSLEEAIQLFAIVLGVGAVVNLGFQFVFEGGLGSLSLRPSPNSDVTGITTSRNTLGRAGALGYVVCLVYARIVRSWILWPALAALNVLLVVATNSATALGAVGGISLLGLVFLGFRGRKTLYGATIVAMTVVFATLTVLTATNLARVTGILGRDSNFTGRLPIWQDSFTFGISERPFLGFGAGGFWQDGVVDFEVQLRSNNFNILHGHNAWVDALLEVGPFGALLLTAIFARALLWSTRHIRAVPTAAGLFPALIVSMGVIYSTSEAGFITRTIQFIMFIVGISAAARFKGEKRAFVPKAERSTQPTTAKR